MATATASNDVRTIKLTGVQRQFLAARDVSVPLIILRTVDPAAAVVSLAKVCVTSDDKPAPVMQWDRCRGFEGINAAGVQLAKSYPNIYNPVDACTKVMTVPEHTVIIALNMHDDYGDAIWRQAFWNLRDPFKKNSRTYVITQPFGGVPSGMDHDVLVIDEPLPAAAELAEIVRKQFDAAKLTAPTDEVVNRAVDATAGLSSFAAEQAVALSLRRSGLDMVALRDRHRQMIQNTKGLTVWQGGETFDNIGGLRGFINFANMFLKGRYRPGATFWIDEVEKVLAGVKGDLTGIAQDYLAVLLAYMQDENIPGILLMGHPGTGKSLLAKAFGHTAGVPVIRADLGAMHGSLVGESQQAIRHALKVVSAVSQGRPVFIATCNSVAILPPEFVNRFKWRFFVDLPDREERARIWQIHIAKRKLNAKQELPNDGQIGQEWNGREVEQCCETAYQLNCSLIEAAKYVVPISQSSAEVMTVRRNEAHGRYLSASYEGPFMQDHKEEEVTVGGRKIRLQGDADAWVAPSNGKPS